VNKLSILCLGFLLQGCVGLAVGSYGTFEDEKISVSISSERNEFEYGASTTVLTKEILISSWGEPDAIEKIGSCEVDTYHDGYSWSGVGAFVVLFPIPLLVPSGSESNRFYFINGRFVRLVSEYGEITAAFGYMCGSSGCNGFAGPVNTDKVRKVEVTWCE
jgi:hypothetical protein